MMPATVKTPPTIAHRDVRKYVKLCCFSVNLTIMLAALSSIFFLGVGLTSSNASMGAISLYAHRAGSASAVYGFTHALLASAVGAMAGLLYQGRLLEPALIMLGCAMLAFSGLWLIHWQSHNKRADT